MFGTYENYAYFRDKQHLTDYTVAKMCNMNRSTISDWKLGKHQPQNKTLKKVAEVLGVSIDDFFKNPKENNKTAIIFNDFDPINQFYERVELNPLPVSEYKIQLSDNREVNLTRDEYLLLKKSLDAYIESWVKLNIKV